MSVSDVKRCSYGDQLVTLVTAALSDPARSTMRRHPVRTSMVTSIVRLLRSTFILREQNTQNYNFTVLFMFACPVPPTQSHAAAAAVLLYCIMWDTRIQQQQD